MEGKIKRLDKQKGYGFITQPNGKDVFCHRSEFPAQDFETMQEGDSVTFDLGESPKGPQAKNVQKV